MRTVGLAFVSKHQAVQHRQGPREQAKGLSSSIPSAHPEGLYSLFLTAVAVSKVCLGPSRQGAELRPGLSSVLTMEVVITATGAAAAAVNIDLSVPCSAF